MQVGIDIQDTEAFKKFIGTKKMNRIFSSAELEYINNKNQSLSTVTGIFCAKEAFFKAIGKGIVLSQLTEVEVAHDALGAPHYNLSSRIITENSLDFAALTLSISHTKTTAVAVCIIL